MLQDLSAIYGTDIKIGDHGHLSLIEIPFHGHPVRLPFFYLHRGDLPKLSR